VHDEQPRGTTFEDLADFLKRPEPDAYEVGAVRECICRSCGGRSFEVAVLEEGNAAKRNCLTCGEHEFIADSADYWDDNLDVAYCACPCGEEEFAAAVGFSLRDTGDVRWIYLGLRCLACDVLGIYEDWKVSYGPSAFLLERA
jgi:hypothetical protein